MSLAGSFFPINRRQSRGASNSFYSFRGGPDDPVGLTAVAGAVGMIAETIGSFVMRVYTGPASKRQPLFDAPQAALLQDGAAGYCTSVDMWSQVVSSIELCENALIWKARDGDGIVRELYPFPTEAVCVYVDAAGKKIVEARIGAERIDITRNVIHVRGWSPIVAVTGQSTIMRHARTLTGAVALETFRGRYFDNDASPNTVLTHPGSPDVKQREALRDSWQARHGGPDGEKTAILWGGITVEKLSSTLDQAQVQQLMDLDVQQVARIFRFYPPALLLSDPAARLPDAESISDQFQRFTLLSRERRIERAISGDPDLFPDRSTYARFDVSEFVRGSIEVTADKVHKLKQVGMISANEGRAELGMEPSTDPSADKLLETPVGAGANQNPAGGTT